MPLVMPQKRYRRGDLLLCIEDHYMREGVNLVGIQMVTVQTTTPSRFSAGIIGTLYFNPHSYAGRYFRKGTPLLWSQMVLFEKVVGRVVGTVDTEDPKHVQGFLRSFAKNHRSYLMQFFER